MEAKEAAGPEVDIQLFNELRSVFERYPDAAHKYAIRWMHQEIKLKIDFEKQTAVSRVEGNRIVTEFQSLSESATTARHHGCCEWYQSGGRWKCVRQCPE